MAYEQKDGQGILFINDKKGNEKAPDRKGNIMMGGVKYDLAGWVKEGKNGPFLSLKASLPRVKDAAVENQKQSYEAAKNAADMDDEIPF